MRTKYSILGYMTATAAATTAPMLLLILFFALLLLSSFIFSLARSLVRLLFFFKSLFKILLVFFSFQKRQSIERKEQIPAAMVTFKS